METRSDCSQSEAKRTEGNMYQHWREVCDLHSRASRWFSQPPAVPAAGRVAARFGGQDVLGRQRSSGCNFRFWQWDLRKFRKQLFVEQPFDVSVVLAIKRFVVQEVFLRNEFVAGHKAFTCLRTFVFSAQFLCALPTGTKGTRPCGKQRIGSRICSGVDSAGATLFAGFRLWLSKHCVFQK